MVPALPVGEAAPRDGSLPSWVGGPRPGRAFGVYVHVPFCSVRCGYCDFNTYTATDLGGGATRASYADAALCEMDLAVGAMAGAGVAPRPASTVFFGGGTPTQLPARDLGRLLGGVRDTWGLAPGAEVTTEANPDSVTPESLRELAAAGFTRVSFGMQSAVPAVLATLDRTHDPRRVPQVVAWASDAGLATSLDLIYGTPGESRADWRASLEAAIATGVDHVSAYALVVEPGTKLAARVRRGEVAPADDDDEAAKYEIADDVLTAAGLQWYEVSNWARGGAQCRHNLGYWRGDEWWGIGPGAHSYLAAGVNGSDAQVLAGPDEGAGDSRGPAHAADASAGVRWWNVKHPRRYAELLAANASPAAGRERLTAADDCLERVMLRIRLREGIGLDEVGPPGRRAVAGLIADGLLDGRAAIGQRAVLTRRGRLLADTVVQALTADENQSGCPE